MKRRPHSGLLACVTVCMLACICAGCRGSYAKSQVLDANTTEDSELALTKGQIVFIEDNASKVLAREAYWTWADGYTDKGYVENAGKRVSVKVISLKRTVIVFIPKLGHTGIMYVRTHDGHLDHPRLADWMVATGKQGVAELIRESSYDSDRYLFRFHDKNELNSTQGQGEWQLELENLKEKYQVIDAEIVLLPVGRPAYEPMTEDKQLLLDKIIEEASKQAETMFDKGEVVTITAPNFNVGDPRIWVLIERNKERADDTSGVVIDMQLNSNPKDDPVEFTSFVIHDIKAERYGVKTDTVDKIKLNSLKILKYKCKGK
jgi:hypothetical protein